MARKKKRSAKQLANDRRLGRMAKARAKKKRGTMKRRNPHKEVTRKKVAKRPALKKSHLWLVFLCKGASVKWLTLANDLRYGWTADKAKAVLFKVKGNAEKFARKLQKKRGYGSYNVGITDTDTTTAQIRAHCTGK